VHFPISIRSFEGKNGKERRPPGVSNRLFQMVILYHMVDLQVFVIDRIVLAH
jgi:hypothetical protein